MKRLFNFFKNSEELYTEEAALGQRETDKNNQMKH